MTAPIVEDWKSYLPVITKYEGEDVEKNILTKQDFILYLIYNLRCISPKEIATLLGSKVDSERSNLRTIQEKGYLTSDYVKFYNEKQKVCFLTTAGLEKVVEDFFGKPPYILDNEKETSEPNYISVTDRRINERYIPHTLAVNGFYLSMIRKEIPVEWIDIKKNIIFDGDPRKAPIKFDAHFKINDKWYMYEQDMGTLDKKSILQKLSAYANHYPYYNFPNSTLLFSINMGKHIKNIHFKDMEAVTLITLRLKLKHQSDRRLLFKSYPPKRVHITRYLKRDVEVEELEKQVLDIRSEKRKISEVKKLQKTFPPVPEHSELEKTKEDLEHLLEEDKVSNKEKVRLRKRLDEIKKILAGEHGTPEKEIEDYDRILKLGLVSKAERRRIEIKKEILRSFIESREIKNIDDRIQYLDAALKRRNEAIEFIRSKTEKQVLLQLAKKRKEVIKSYIQQQIYSKSNNTLVELFRVGIDMFIGESDELAESINSNSKGNSYLHILTGALVHEFNRLGLKFNCQEKAKAENIPIVIDRTFTIQDHNNKIVHIDLFDLTENNIGSYYRWEEYVKYIDTLQGPYENRRGICLADNGVSIEKYIKDKSLNYHLKYLYFTLAGYTDIDIYKFWNGESPTQVKIEDIIGDMKII